MVEADPNHSKFFSINLDEIALFLKEENSGLLKRRDDLLLAYSRVPNPLPSNEVAEKALLFLGQLTRILANARTARLSQGQGFRDAERFIEKFFKEIEVPIKQVVKDIQERLTTFMEEIQIQNPSDEPSPATEIVTSVPGNKSIISVNSLSSNVLRVPLVWQINGFDRPSLDLEEIRPYLANSAILKACEKHLAAHGPNRIKGGAYKRVAAID